MNDPKGQSEDNRAEWIAPVLVELSVNMDQIESGYDPGHDGAGGYTTSLS
jgi:hypothetical protein